MIQSVDILWFGDPGLYFREFEFFQFDCNEQVESMKVFLIPAVC